MHTQYGGWTTSRARNNAVALSAIWLITGILVLPALLHWPASVPHYGPDRYLRTAALYGVLAGIGLLIFRIESRSLAKTHAFGLIFLNFLLTSLVNNFHSHFVDHGPSYFGFISNLQWQIQTHNSVIQLSPAAVPHVYRFLPDAIVRWLEIWHLPFEPSRDLFRLIFDFLLFYAVYRYARLYTTFAGAALAIVLSAIVYPVTFENYAGQLTDPMAHLAFVLALFFLETNEFPFFLTTLLIGSLAKESVLAMAGYYLLFRRRDPRFAPRALALVVLCPLTYLGIRFYVLGRAVGQPSGGGALFKLITDRDWLSILETNLKDPQWPVFVPLTGLALIPFLLLAWRSTPKSLKHVAVYVLAVVFLFNLFFSWFAETRNLMPAVFVLAVIAGRFMTEEPRVEKQRDEVSMREEVAVA